MVEASEIDLDTNSRSMIMIMRNNIQIKSKSQKKTITYGRLKIKMELIVCFDNRLQPDKMVQVMSASDLVHPLETDQGHQIRSKPSRQEKKGIPHHGRSVENQD